MTLGIVSAPVNKLKVFTATSLLILGAVLLSCGGGTSVSNPPIPNIAGAWEFLAVSSTGSTTGIEVALKEGQSLVNGLMQPDGQITATSAQITFTSLSTVSQNLNISAFGGGCLPITASNSLGPGSVTALGSPISFTFTENGNVFNVTGTLGGDGQSLLDGTYTAQSGNTCLDTGGTITGNVVPKLSGMFTGQICPPATGTCASAQDFTDAVNATATESSSGTLTLSLAFTSGPDSGATFNLTGPVTGSAFSVSGTFHGQLVTYYGYAEPIFNSTLQTSVPSLYLVDATTDPANPGYAGTVALPQS